MGLLGSAGFDLYSSDPNLLTSNMVSPVLSPISTDDSLSALDLSPEISTQSGAVLTRTRSSTENSMSGMASALQQPGSKAKTPLTSTELGQTESTPSQTRSKSHSPTSGDVRILTPDLACVGLADNNVDNWSLKIIKLVAFPDLILSAKSARPSAARPEDLYAGDAHHVWESQNPLFEPFVTMSTPPDRGRPSTSSSSSASSCSGEDGYFSHSPTGENSSGSVLSSAASRSYPDVTKPPPSTSPSFKPVAKRLITPLSPIEPVTDARGFDSNEMDHMAGPGGGQPSAVGFFSFTRTAEGSSLTTDVSLLASLFPPDERHMVICSGELDAFERLTTDTEGDETDEDSGGILKCLQIDLRRFGLGEHS
jgi:hypothetical protein